jgi:Mg-chelatase subunit ChlD
MKEIELIIVLDSSGSMYEIRNNTLRGINELLNKQRMEGPTRVTIVSFSHVAVPLVCGEDINDISEMTEEDYDPTGSTALYDGIGMAIEMAEKRKIVSNEDIGVMLVIITDGYENASCKYNRLQIKKILEQKEEDGWIISYLGANINSHEEASKIGATYAANWTTNASSVDTLYSSVSDVSSVLRSASIDQLDEKIKYVYEVNLGNG